MTVYASPPAFTREFMERHGPEVFDPDFIAADLATALTLPSRDYSQTMDLTMEERKAIGLAQLKKETEKLEWEVGNGVVLCGPPAAGKSGLAEALQTELPYMAHTPTDALMHKHEIEVPRSSQAGRYTAIEAEIANLEGYIYSRVRGINEMQKDLSVKREQHTLSGDEIVIGGIIQSLVTLCAYTHTYEVNPESGAIELPESLYLLTILMLRTWAPRFIVYVDAPYEERIQRARAQDTVFPGSWAKRQLPFQYETEIRELTISTVKKLAAFARKTGHSFHLIYYPTGQNQTGTPEGFIPISSIESLTRFIEYRQEHPSGKSRKEEYLLSRQDGTWDD